jgi:molybdate transport system ATP-binding protein
MTLEARFRIQRGEFTLDVDLSLPDRGISAIFGPSGCGKTTLLRAIAGLEHDPGGRCRVGEETWQNGGRFLPPHRRSLGFVFQEASLFEHLSVRRNLEFGLKRTATERRRVNLNDVAALLDVTRLLERDTQGLSGGERQRVAIARALLASPSLLLMDEPLASLDRPSKREILPYLERLHDDLAMPVLYVTHAADEAARLADHLVLLESGKVRAAGPTAELLTRLDVAEDQGAEAEAIVEAVVAEHDDGFQLTNLKFAGGQFSVAGRIAPVGRRVRLRVLARDVSLTLEAQTGTSILNIFPAVVDELAETGSAQVLVRLDIAGVPILARITRKSAAALEIGPGKKVFAQVKAVAVLN